MKPSDIETGFYYEKSNVPGWLRFIVSMDKHQVLYADFIDYGQCRVESLGRWANNQRYTAEKAAERFPKEVADISKVPEGLPMATDSDYSPSRSSSPHDGRQYRRCRSFCFPKNDRPTEALRPVGQYETGLTASEKVPFGRYPAR